MKKYILFIGTLLMLVSCSQSIRTENKEARDDTSKMVDAFVKRERIKNHVYPLVETKPVRAKRTEDAADDVAIWVNPNNSKNSVVIGTDKTAGLYLYDLQGKELQYLSCGKMNNVDLRTINDRIIILATNRTTNSIDIFELDSISRTISKIKSIKSHTGEVYGFTSGVIDKNTLAMFYTDKKGNIEQWNMKVGSDYLEETYIKTFNSYDKTEGLVFDDNSHKLYAAVEEKGIIVFNLKNDTEQWVESSIKKNNLFIEYDIEGITLFDYNGNHYLLASVQGNFSYAIFDTNSLEYITSFTIETKGDIDMVIETDGLDIVTDSLSVEFPNGMLVVQDGFNYNKRITKHKSQNFKYIDMREVYELLD